MSDIWIPIVAQFLDDDDYECDDCGEVAPACDLDDGRCPSCGGSVHPA